MSPDHLAVLRTEHRAQTTLAAEAIAASSQAALSPVSSSHAAGNAGASLQNEEENENEREAESIAARKRHSRHSSSVTNMRALRRLAEQKDHLNHTSPLAVGRSTATTTTTAAPVTAPSATADDGQTAGGGGVMGVRRKKSWTRSLSGTIKTLAAPLSPVIPSSISSSSSSRKKALSSSSTHSRTASTANGQQVFQAADGEKKRTRAATLANAGSSSSTLRPSSPAGAQKLSKDTPFKTRLRDHISELGDLEVNTTDLKPLHAAISRNASMSSGDNTPAGTSTSAGVRIGAPTPGGVDADDEDDFNDEDENTVAERSHSLDMTALEESEDEEDSLLRTIPENEREYYPLAEKDKPLSARIRYPSDDDNMGEFSVFSRSGAAASNAVSPGPNVLVGGRLHAVTESPVPFPTGAGTSASGSSSTMVEPSHHHKGRLELEKAETSNGRLVLANTVNANRPSRKVPIGTRLTMTSRAGFFQDRIVSPSMVRIKIPELHCRD